MEALATLPLPALRIGSRPGGRAIARPADKPGDEAVLAALRAGDEAAFARLVDELTPGMVRLARGFVASTAVAEEVVQETWIAALRGLDRFEGRSTLKTWLYRITINTAKTRAAREGRSVPFSSLDGDGPAVDPNRFHDASHPAYPHHWAAEPSAWGADEAVLAREGVRAVLEAVEGLPPAQRSVILMRDVEGCDAAEACSALGLSEGNQRVLLHRARSKVRAALETRVEESAA